MKIKDFCLLIALTTITINVAAQKCPEIAKAADIMFIAISSKSDASTKAEGWHKLNEEVQRCETLRNKKILLQEEVGEGLAKLFMQSIQNDPSFKDAYATIKVDLEKKAAEEQARKSREQAEEQARKSKEEAEELARFQRRYDLIENSDSGAYTSVARILGSEARIRMIGAKGAVQVTQVASETQLEFARIQIKQNDEIIRLLRLLV